MKYSPRQRGIYDCCLDDMENCPFSSIGGLGARDKPSTPRYINQYDRTGYVIGYIEQALKMYGKDWKTCEFSWGLAVVINSEDYLKEQSNDVTTDDSTEE